MIEIGSVIREIEETIAILEEQRDDPSFQEAGGFLQIESEKMKLSALREQQQRSTGCEHCAQGEEMAYGRDSLNRTGYIYLDGNLLTADLYSESMAVAALFCPMCGKRLDV